MDQKQSQPQGTERRQTQTQFQGEERRKPADDSIFEKTTWIPGGPVRKQGTDQQDDKQDEDPGGHA